MAITYCLVCNITGEKYYGSSKHTLEQRMNQHKWKSNTCCSRHIILRGDYDIYQLAEYETIEEAEMKEDWYIDNKECINKQRVRLTDEERTQYRRKKIECEFCKFIGYKRELKRHQRSKRCLKYQ